jgi:Tfp pilus assembly protein PilF
LALDPDYEMAWLNKAALYMTLGQLNDAKKVLEKVLSINPSNVQAREGIKRIKSAG